MAEFELKALITGVDRLSPALSKMQKKIRGFKRQADVSAVYVFKNFNSSERLRRSSINT